MFSNRLIILAGFLTLRVFSVAQQDFRTTDRASSELEVHYVYASNEANYHGFSVVFNLPITKTKNYFQTSFGVTSYFDFIGESKPNAELTKDVDMRIIPYLNLGYNIRLKKIEIIPEINIGPSIAITKGTLINTNIGFEQSYSNSELLFHFGPALSVRYNINAKNKIGIRGFYPFVLDDAWTLPSISLGWVRKLTKREKKNIK